MAKKWAFPAGPGRSFWFRGASDFGSRRTNLELRYFRLLFSGSATSLLFHTVGPRLSALVGSGNQITDVKAAHPVSPGPDILWGGAVFLVKQEHAVLILTPPKSYQAQPSLEEIGT